MRVFHSNWQNGTCFAGFVVVLFFLAEQALATWGFQEVDIHIEVAEVCVSTHQYQEAAARYALAEQLLDAEKETELWEQVRFARIEALGQAAVRISPQQGNQLLAEALELCQQCLLCYPRQSYPRQWARSQNSLGSLLLAQGMRLREEGEELLMASLDAYKLALEVRTKTAFPEDWAATQTNLGNLLCLLGKCSEGRERIELLKASRVAYEAALEVRGRGQNFLKNGQQYRTI